MSNDFDQLYCIKHRLPQKVQESNRPVLKVKNLLYFLGGNVTSVGWQVTLCDPTWHVSSRSGMAG